MKENRKKHIKDEMIEQVRQTGLSIAANAENIVNKYKYLSDELTIEATFRCYLPPNVEVRQTFIPEFVIDNIDSSDYR